MSTKLPKIETKQTESPTPEVASPKDTQLAEAGGKTLYLVDQMEEDAGAGFENVNRSRDLQMPYIQIVQGLSPELKRENAKYIKGAEQGMIFNSVTRKLHSTTEPDGKPLKFILCDFDLVYNEWKLRNLGGGFVKTHRTASILKNTHKGGKNDKQDICNHANDHQIVTTAIHPILVIEDDGMMYPALLSLVSTQLKKSRSLMSKLDAKRKTTSSGKTIRPPLFASVCEMTSVAEKNNEGEYYGFKLDVVGDATQEQYDEGKMFHKEFQSFRNAIVPAEAVGAEPEPEEGAEPKPF